MTTIVSALCEVRLRCFSLTDSDDCFVIGRPLRLSFQGVGEKGQGRQLAKLRGQGGRNKVRHLSQRSRNGAERAVQWESNHAQKQVMRLTIVWPFHALATSAVAFALGPVSPRSGAAPIADQCGRCQGVEVRLAAPSIQFTANHDSDIFSIFPISSSSANARSELSEREGGFFKPVVRGFRSRRDKSCLRCGPLWRAAYELTAEALPTHQHGVLRRSGTQRDACTGRSHSH